MAIQAFRFAIASAVLLLATTLMSPLAHAQVSGGGDLPKAASGLGEALPNAEDLVSDPAWRVYEFERGGIRYIQINDSTGRVRAAVGRIDELFWTMPMGSDADRVNIDASPVLSGQRQVLYRANEVEVILIRTGSGDYWEVRRPEATH
ncbi:MAG: hypothetical protein ACOY82_04785 [Pseudomonadota bacterium]